MYIPIVDKDSEKVEVKKYYTKDFFHIGWFIQFQGIFWVLAALLLFESPTEGFEGIIENLLVFVTSAEYGNLDFTYMFKFFSFLFLIICYFAMSQASADNFIEQIMNRFNRKITFTKFFSYTFYVTSFMLILTFLDEGVTNIELIPIVIYLTLLIIYGFIRSFKDLKSVHLYTFIFMFVMNSILAVLNSNLNSEILDNYIVFYASITVMTPFLIIISRVSSFILVNFSRILIQEYHSSNISKMFIYNKWIREDLRKGNKIKDIVPIINIKNDITRWVVGRNLFNLMNSIVLAFFFGSVFLAIFRFSDKELLEKYLLIMGVLTFVKLLSRSSEIVYSFYKDIVSEDDWKNTFLSRGDRIALAIKSLIEIMILSSLVTSIILAYQNVGIIMNNDFDELLQLLVFYLIVFMRSIAISLFNISFSLEITLNGFLVLFLSVIHLIQLVTSAVLITLSIAGYMGRNNEKVFYNIEFNDNEYILNKYLYTKTNLTVKNLIKNQNTLLDLRLAAEDLWRNEKISNSECSHIFELIDKNKDTLYL